MYFMLKSNVILRNYDSFGYVTDNRNFGYKNADNKEDVIGDKIVSQSGAVFLSALGQMPQTLDDIVSKIISHFGDVDIETITNDAREFYSVLEQDGFIVSGETMHECEKKDLKFSYKKMAPSIEKDDSYLKKGGIQTDTQEFLDEYFKNEPQLTNIYIEITSKCNERCMHCYIPHEKKVNHMQTDLFYSILNQCRDMKLLHLTLTGGEPMLHPNFLGFIRECRLYNMSVNVLSNLTLLNDEIIEEMRTNSLLSVQVSLYSMDPNIHDTITRMEGSCELTKNSIMKLVENDIPLQISCTIMKQNKDCYMDVVHWAKKHDVRITYDYVVIGKYDSTIGNLDNRLSVSDVMEVIESKIINEPNYLNLIVTESEKKINETPNDIVCSVCHSSLCVADNGTVYPCAGWQGYAVGNVNEVSLKEIWNTSKKIKYLRDLRKKDFPKCINCPEKEYCTMCMVRNANENPLGDPLLVNEYYCEIAKLHKKIIQNRRQHV